MSQHLLPELIQIARQAGEAILAVYESDFAVCHKEDDTPLTLADLKAHQLLMHELGKLTPDLPLLSEEGSPPPLTERCQWQRYWLIDPLDGTREFIRRSGEFSVNIALIENHRPILGLIYAPVSNTCYHAAKGHGSFRIDASGSATRLRARRHSAQQLVVTTSLRAGQDIRTRDLLQRLPEHTLVTMGSALKSCLIAEGKADIYPRVGPTSEWDTAAAQIIIEEAGGLITDMNLQPLRYNTRETLLNPNFIAFADRSVDWRHYLNETA